MQLITKAVERIVKITPNTMMMIKTCSDWSAFLFWIKKKENKKTETI